MLNLSMLNLMIKYCNVKPCVQSKRNAKPRINIDVNAKLRVKPKRNAKPCKKLQC